MLYLTWVCHGIKAFYFFFYGVVTKKPRGIDGADDQSSSMIPSSILSRNFWNLLMFLVFVLIFYLVDRLDPHILANWMWVGVHHNNNLG